MTRQLLASVFMLGLLALTAVPGAQALELPLRKAGLWEMKMARTGGSMPEMTMQHCTDASTDKQMRTALIPGKETCSRQDTEKTATGYVTDSVCSVTGLTITSRVEITGDFNSAYTVKAVSLTEGAPSGVPREATTTIEAKWLGPCKADQKPGDIVTPGGIKMNVGDLDKLKAMLPKSMQK